jgi:hypothetical protein
MNGEEILADQSSNVEDFLFSKLLLEDLRHGVAQLAEDDRQLLTALFLDEKSESEVSRALGVTQQAVNKHRQNKKPRPACHVSTRGTFFGGRRILDKILEEGKNVAEKRHICGGRGGIVKDDFEQSQEVIEEPADEGNATE